MRVESKVAESTVVLEESRRSQRRQSVITEVRGRKEKRRRGRGGVRRSLQGNFIKKQIEI